jgi:hypothetical protein
MAMADASAFMDVTAKDLLIAGGWLMTMVGWFVSNRQSVSRERRKEVRSEVDACGKAAEAILLLCRRYYTKPATDSLEAETSAQLNFDLYRLFSRVERLEERYKKFDAINCAVELLDSATGGEFQSADRAAVTANADILRKIEADIHVLMEALEAGFADQFD